MSELISGREAWLANFDGEQVWVSRSSNNQWFPFGDEDWTVEELKSGTYKFRIKPPTIAINGIEVPAPFEPQAGEEYYYINSGREGGYAMKLHDGKRLDVMAVQFGAWRTEEEVKQVVAALRQVLRG